MRATEPESSRIVIDSNLAVWAVLPALSQVDMLARFAGWQQTGTRLFAPTLWVAESVSVIRGSVFVGDITPEEGLAAINDLFALDVETLPMSAPLCRSALEWAGRLRQRRAYDGFYLALAEELGAEFWTADQRLANAARQAGAIWVHWIGETGEGRS
jgi:predicted nucleic acid-binding protein